jgi:hypothetical protein
VIPVPRVLLTTLTRGANAQDIVQAGDDQRAYLARLTYKNPAGSPALMPPPAAAGGGDDDDDDD